MNVPLGRKGTTRSKRIPAWLTSGVKEAIPGKKATFRKWMSCLNEEIKKETPTLAKELYADKKERKKRNSLLKT